MVELDCELDSGVLLYCPNVQAATGRLVVHHGTVYIVVDDHHCHAEFDDGAATIHEDHVHCYAVLEVSPFHSRRIHLNHYYLLLDRYAWYSGGVVGVVVAVESPADFICLKNDEFLVIDLSLRVAVTIDPLMAVTVYGTGS